MILRPPRSTQSRSSAASDVYKRQAQGWRELRTRIDDARLNRWARQALEVAADAQTVPRQLVVRQQLDLRLPPGFIVAVLDRCADACADDQLRLRGNQATVVVHRLAEGDASLH